MTKGKLIEFLVKIQKREIKSEDIVLLKELSDEEIDIIFNMNNKAEMINLLANENFKNIPKETKDIIIEILKNLREGSLYCSSIIKAATNKNIIESGNLLEIIKLLRSTKEIYRREQIVSIAANNNIIATGQALEICKLISRTNNELLKIVVFAATGIHITRSGNVVNVVKEIIDAKTPEKALNIYYSYMNEYKELSLLDALSNGTIDKIDFWTLLSEEPEKAINLIIQINSEEEISKDEKITKEKLGIVRTKKK